MRVNDDIQDGSAFAIPDLYKTSTLAHFDDVAPSLEELQPLSLSNESHLDLQVNGEVKSGLLDLQPFEYGPVEDVGVLEDSSIASLESLDAPEIVEEDVWAASRLDKGVPIATNIKSWETFYNQQSKEKPGNLFLSEAGPQVYDAALSNSLGKAARDLVASTTSIVIESQTLLSSLIQLALGRESVLYYYDVERRSFRLRKSNIRMSGYSLQTFESLSTRLQNHGNSLRDLRGFVLETQRSSRACRACFALVAAFIPILDALESRIAFPSSPIRSLLQLQELIERPSQILQCLSEVVAKIVGVRADEQLLSVLFEFVQSSEHSSVLISQTLRGLLASASRPWLNSVDNWLGLRDRSDFSAPARFPDFTLARKIDASTEVGPGDTTKEFDFNPSLLPSFISTEDAETLFETGKSLRMLEAHQPNHPLTTQSTIARDDTLKLEWRFTWSDVEAVAAKANAYESRLRKALQDLSSTSQETNQVLFQRPEQESTEHTIRDATKESTQSFIEVSKNLFEKPLPDISALQTLVGDINDPKQSEMFAPPISLLSTLSFKPVTSACARLIDHASLRLLFIDHHLRAHLSLIYRFNLLSDGLFASRLSQALFSPQLSTTERQPGHFRSGPLGLKLGHRETWPPASSELRLALTGIIADSYFNSIQVSRKGSPYATKLPGDLSFAVRSMSPDELGKCSDPNALFALDFLRIQYTAIAPLNAVITPKSLEKYDAIFKLLLRCRRMLFVVAQLNFSPRRLSARNGSPLRSTRYQRATALRNESHHFVSTVCNHFFSNISSHWQLLDQRLESLERTANSDSEHIPSERVREAESESESISSIPALRAFHEHLLDSMMFALLLRKRQEQVMALLEEIWGLVLRFAWLVNRSDASSTDAHSQSQPRFEERAAESTADGTGAKIDAEISQLHAQFRRKARVFVEVCRGLSERTPKDREMAGVGLGMEHLVLVFDMNGFYTRT